MKKQLAQNRENLGILSFYCLLLIIILSLVGCGSEQEFVDYVEILSRVQEGDDRQQAIEKLSDAWYHTECPFSDGAVEDIFFYGPRDRESVNLIMIGILSEPQGDTLKVTRTGTYESYFLDAPDFGEYCQPPVQNAFD